MTNRIDSVMHDHGFDPPPKPLNPQTFNSPWIVAGVVERVVSLWESHTALQIAEIVSREFGLKLTRASITGKLDRLGLLNKITGRRTPEEQQSRKLERAATYNASRRGQRGEQTTLRIVPSSPIPRRPIAPTEVTPLNLTLAELPDSGCHFIAGDDLLYCGHDRRGNSSYCEFHHGIVWVKPLGRGARVSR